MKFHRKYYNHVFIIPQQQVLENLKNFYIKYGSMKPKSLKELKRLALIEAKKASQTLMNVSKKERLEIIISKEAVCKILQSTFDSVNSLLVKFNHNFKNERRKVYENNEEYMNIIKKFEINKLKLVRYYLKSICKSSKINFDSLQRSVFHYLGRNDTEVMAIVNSTRSLGKHNAIAPSSMTSVEVIEILDKYYQNLNYIVTRSPDNDVGKYALIIVNDIIYEYFGLEEEQIFSLVSERPEIRENKNVQDHLIKIKHLVSDNLNLLFDL